MAMIAAGTVFDTTVFTVKYPAAAGCLKCVIAGQAAKNASVKILNRIIDLSLTRKYVMTQIEELEANADDLRKIEIAYKERGDNERARQLSELSAEIRNAATELRNQSKLWFLF